MVTFQPASVRFPGGTALTGVTGRVRSGCPDKTFAPLSGKTMVVTFQPASVRFPGGAALTGATGRVRSGRPDKTFAPPSGKTIVVTFQPASVGFPAGAALTGATGRVRSGSPDKALAPLSRPVKSLHRSIPVSASQATSSLLSRPGCFYYVQSSH